MALTERERIAAEWRTIADASQAFQNLKQMNNAKLWGLIQPAVAEQIERSLEEIEFLKNKL